MRPSLTIALLLVLLASACKKSTSTLVALSANATIINTGPIAADGCGWLIKLNDNSEYSPINLSSDFEQDQLTVHISYTILSTNTACGNVVNSPGVRQIKIDAIQKIN